MSTAVLSSKSALYNGAVLRRFVWKEYRMLRGLWLAIAVMGAIVQWIMNALMLPTVDHAFVLLSAALFSALLYAVGAAATTFSVEHEEGTYSFLTGLPARWWPVFAGKFLVVLASAIVLAIVLSTSGWMISGFETPGGRDAGTALGMFGVAILEGVAWGTFFSLVVKRPIAAAILTLVVGAVAVHWAVNASSSYPVASLVPRAYVEAISLRLAIVALLLVASVAIASRWLVVGTQSVPGTFGGVLDIGCAFWARTAATLGRVARVSHRRSASGMMSRLVWQTWRESWKLLLLPLVVAGVLYLAVGAFLGMEQPSGDIGAVAIIATMLFVPALYGAMAFGADQRRQSYRFLAEHAAQARWVWLARHIVWLGALVALSVGVALLIFGTATYAIRASAQQSLEHYLRYGYNAYWGVPEASYAIGQGMSYWIRGLGLATFGILTAYAIGQLCSMLVRSEIMAAFIALVLSAVLSPWVAALFAWELSGWLFLFPLAAGLFLATWLRAPNWIAQRRGIRTWIKPLLAVVVPFLLITSWLPAIRIAQVPGAGQEGVSSWEVSRLAEDFKANGRDTAETYTQAADRLLAGPKEDPLEKWRDTASDLLGDFDKTKIPVDELDAFEAAKKRNTEVIRESIAAAVDAAIEISKRPKCHFDFDLRQIAPNQYGVDDKQWGVNSYLKYAKVNELLNVVAGEPMTDKDEPFEGYLATLRMSRHIRSNQPTVVFLDQLTVEQTILSRIGVWALEKDRTKEELRDALDRLVELFHAPTNLNEPLLADHLLVRDALTGDEMPISLSLSPDSSAVYLAYLANQLPWERQRALNALDQVTAQNLKTASELSQFVTSSRIRDEWTDYVHRWLRPMYSMSGHSLPEWEFAAPAAATSYLMQLEYKARSPIYDLFRAYVDTEVYRRATLIKIALAMYRLEHGSYPSRLADLAPTYLDPVPLDPYSSQPFHYNQVGFDLPLRYYSGGEQGRVDANTPLFWSVGAGNVYLKQVRYTSQEQEGDDPDGPVREVSETNYTFSSEDPSWWNDQEFVFPLPK